jgi:predicted tellurium resistance membrane protein TerC
MDWLTDPKVWFGFLSLTALEIVLGIDNIIFISILSSKLPAHQQAKARQIGLLGAMVMRILLLLSLTWVMRLTTPLFTLLAEEISGRDLILILGGLFLIGKSTHEIHTKLEGVEGERSAKVLPSFTAVITQIMILDIVFSLDSVITAIGMVSRVGVMIAAVVVAVLFMLVFAGKVSAFVDRHPTIKMLALAFLVLIGVNLVAEGFDQHIPRGYTYFAMAFSLGVEMLNIRSKRKADPVHLRQPISEVEPPTPA